MEKEFLASLVNSLFEYASQPIVTREDAELEVSEYSSAGEVRLTPDEQTEVVNAMMDDIYAA